MTEQLLEQEERIFINPNGFHVPESEMAPQNILKDDMIMELIGKAKKLSAEINDFKSKVFTDTQDFIALLSHEYNLESKSTHGNLTFTSFDGKSQIKISIADQITFGAEIDIAKQLINEVMKEELADVNNFLREIVTDAFQTNNDGQYNKGRILTLRKYRSSNDTDKWQDAMRAIDDGIISGGSKTYITFHERNKFGKWIQIPLASKNA